MGKDSANHGVCTFVCGYNVLSIWVWEARTMGSSCVWKLVPSKCDQKYGAVSKASDRIHLNGAVFNEIPVQNGNADHLTVSNEHRKTTNNEEHGISYHSKVDVWFVIIDNRLLQTLCDAEWISCLRVMLITLLFSKTSVILDLYAYLMFRTWHLELMTFQLTTL